eukprot:CAMPEP_0183309612 /NCGR_PEP_ID=MMETSP0160_2-20130417/25444_1 /TAXON_ID=2839 ORGANISM="Odontella Sinensis, Strain Grunow 1884" /NCGR_SAMPLE_ID=MMETSP0160_2 /ASSEMBLY_ACC=CAM_ASM_000250 /LENGTH=423 /DNA_ID=CAMNT_0025473667 /DNA_START=132 /DNA_END=1403 /DNA_ORIENTATION=-
MKLPRQLVLILIGLIVFSLSPVVLAEDGGGDDAVDDAVDDAADDAVADAADDAVDDVVEENDDGGGGNGGNGGGYNYNVVKCDGDDCIKYWTEYAMLPKKCITYNGVDMIVFSVFEKGYKQCSNEPMGTYITPVPTFVQAYLDQLELNELDMGNDDYVSPDAAQYAQCSQYNGNNGQYSVMLGCDDSNPHKLAVNIYTDATCDTRDVENGMDDANIDVSDVQIPFKSCQACVTWLDKNDDEVDDQYYENKQMYAPLCSQVWAKKETCNKKCQKLGKNKEETPSWNKSDKILLALLGAFAAAMMVSVIHKRRSMQEFNNSLLASEMHEPIKPVAGSSISEPQLLGGFGVVCALIFIFAFFVVKAMTWTLLLVLNLALFGYLLKLVMDSSTSCGGFDDDSDDEDENDVLSPKSNATGATTLPDFT